MTLTEMKCQIEDRLKNIFPNKVQDGILSFVNSNGIPFHVVCVGKEPPWDFIVIEYEDTMEDGDAFYPSDYFDFDSLFDAVLKEIKDAD